MQKNAVFIIAIIILVLVGGYFFRDKIDLSPREPIKKEPTGDIKPTTITPTQMPACNDGKDNDLDGFVDFPLDCGCDSKDDNEELEFIPQGYVPICDPVDLGEIKNDFNGEYIQMRDLDMQGVSFEPIGKSGAQNFFTGVYDGNGYAIKNLNFVDSARNFTGLFGIVSGDAQILNVKLENVNIVAKDNVGAVAGRVYNNVVISNSQASGNVEGNKFVGGLAGQVSDSSLIDNSGFDGIVKGNAEVGGFVGFLGFGNTAIKNSYSNAVVNYLGMNTNCDGLGNDCIGGFVGSMRGSSSVSNSHSQGKINAPGASIVGGFVGRSSSSALNTITNSYSIVDITGGNYRIGGFAGAHEYGEISNSYSIGNVQGNIFVGGFVGQLLSNIKNSYAKGDKVEGVQNVGGFVGEIASGAKTDISNSYAEIKEVSGQKEVGGFAGKINSDISYSSISKSYTKGKVIASLGSGLETNGVGGFAGKIDSGTNTITDSYAETEVDASGKYGAMYIGGFVGLMGNPFIELYDNQIINSYVFGSVKGGGQSFETSIGGFVGGIFGANYNPGGKSKIMNSYSSAVVKGLSGNVGGFAGNASIFQASGGPLPGNSPFLNFTGLHWDKNIAGGTLLNCGDTQCVGIQSHTTSEMRTQATYAKWNFLNNWNIVNGKSYPWLKWQAVDLKQEVYYPFNALNTESLTPDLSLYGRHANANGIEIINSIRGNVFRFSLGDYVNTNSDLDVSQFTLAGWFKLDKLTSETGQSSMRIIDKGKGGQDFVSYALLVDSSNKLVARFYFANNAQSSIDVVYPTALQKNKWYFAAATLDGNTFKLYIDGNLAASKATTNTPYNNNQPVFVGAQQTTSGFDNFLHGSLDDVRVYSRALTQAEITALYLS